MSRQQPEREAKTLRDTYYAFGLTPGEPTFEYTMEQADADGYLVMPTPSTFEPT